MVFNSYIFVLLFLPITLIGWFSLNHYRLYDLASAWLIVASFLFCAYLDISYLLVLAANIFVNYGFYVLLRKMEERTKRKAVLVVGLAINIGQLLIFKYTNFFVENLNSVLGSDIMLMKLILPIGISFYTFNQISFLVDTYRGEIMDCKLINYAIYISYFPKLIMGPIVKYNNLIPQFLNAECRKLNWDNVAQGFYIFTLGLAKKVLLANTFASAVDWGYQNIVGLNSVETAVIILSYTLQIYFDFSGYCDMALGIGKMMNIELPVNFNSPYKAITITDFWDRWHITLTKFFTTYLYIPLGGNRKGKLRTYINTMIVFLVSGFWHGANWTFLLWGGVHGLFSVLTKCCKKTFDRIPKAINWFVTFCFVNAAWVFFRADTISGALLIFKRLLSIEVGGIRSDLLKCFRLPELKLVFDSLKISSLSHGLYAYFLLYFFVAFCCIVGKNANERMKIFKPDFLRSIAVSVLLVWCILSFSGTSTFVYMNF